jgi:agmatine deiminase
MLGSGLALCTAHAAPDPRALDRANLRDCPLPDGLPLYARQGGDAALVEGLAAMRAARPVVFGPTAARPAGSRPVPDTAPMSELLLVYPAWIDHDESYATLIGHASRHGRVRVVPLTDEVTTPLERVLASAGADLSRVQVDAAVPVDSVWVRDWGPLPLDGPGGPAWLDARYSPDCFHNDAYPSARALVEPGPPVVRSRLFVDGGNLAVDPAGRCYTTRAMATHNALSVPALEAALVREAGCADAVVLEALVGNVIDHVDMLLAPTADGDLLLAAFDAAEDPANAAVMARNRATLAARPRADGTRPALIDIPSPAPGWSLDGPVVRTWANLLPFNGVVFLPAYADAAPERQAAAVQAVSAAFPGRKVVLVPSDALIRQGGSVHCVARGLP